MLFVHETVRTTGNMPAMLLGHRAPYGHEATGIVETVILGEPALLLQPFRRVPQIVYGQSEILRSSTE